MFSPFSSSHLWLAVRLEEEEEKEEEEKEE